MIVVLTCFKGNTTLAVAQTQPGVQHSRLQGDEDWGGEGGAHKLSPNLREKSELGNQNPPPRSSESGYTAAVFETDATITF